MNATTVSSSSGRTMVGAIVAYIGSPSYISSEWLICDGRPFDGGKYPQLAEMLPSKITPNLCGYFLRGLDPTGTIDPEGASRQPGSIQACAIQNHTHSYNVYALKGSAHGYSGGSDDWDTPAANTGATGGKETRPVNVAVMYLICAGKPVFSS